MTAASGVIPLAPRRVVSSAAGFSGALQARRVEVDPCQEEIDAVSDAQRAVDGVDGQIAGLQQELQTAPPGHKATLVELIRRLQEEDLPAAMAALDASRRRLAFCRSRLAVVLGSSRTWRCRSRSRPRTTARWSSGPRPKVRLRNPATAQDGVET